MGGVPCIRSLRIPVATVVGMVADCMSDPEILSAYPDLEAEDIREAMHYAAEAVRERELPLAAARKDDLTSNRGCCSLTSRRSSATLPKAASSLSPAESGSVDSH